VSLKAVSTKLEKSTCPGISPAAVNALETCCSELITAGVMGTALLRVILRGREHDADRQAGGLGQTLAQTCR